MPKHLRGHRWPTFRYSQLSARWGPLAAGRNRLLCHAPSAIRPCFWTGASHLVHLNSHSGKGKQLLTGICPDDERNLAFHPSLSFKMRKCGLVTWRWSRYPDANFLIFFQRCLCLITCPGAKGYSHNLTPELNKVGWGNYDFHCDIQSVMVIVWYLTELKSTE